MFNYSLGMKYNSIQDKFNSLLNVPMEKWLERGVKIKSCSANSGGLINSCFAIMRQTRYYVFRKHECINGQFTGKQSFIVEVRSN